MRQPTTAREALIVEALGDMATLIDRLEALTPVILETRESLAEANAEQLRRLVAFESRMSAFAEQAKARSVEHIVRCTDQLARRSMEQQTLSMRGAARTAIEAELNAALQRGTAAFRAATDDDLPHWHRWLTYMATAVGSAAASCCLTLWWVSR